jgi:hypothetical protein
MDERDASCSKPLMVGAELQKTNESAAARICELLDCASIADAMPYSAPRLRMEA